MQQWLECIVEEVHAPCEATGQESGWSVAEDIGSKYDFSFNYFRTKYIGSQGLPTSFSAYQQPLTNDTSDIKTLKTAEGIVKSHDELFKRMKVDQESIDKHFKGLHGDGQIKKFGIADSIQEKYQIMDIFSKLQDLAHNVENTFDRVKFT